MFGNFMPGFVCCTVVIVVRSTEQYDAINNKWTASVKIVEKRCGQNGAALRDKVCVCVGGDSESPCPLDTAEVQNITTRQLTSTLPMILTRFMFNVNVGGSKVCSLMICEEMQYHLQYHLTT